MNDIYKISQALEDMRNYYGLKEIKHVILNMDDPEDIFITFQSNKPTVLNHIKEHDRHTLPDILTYKLSLSIMVSSIFPEE